MEITFKVAMDNEQKKAGNATEVKLDISFDGVDPELIQKHAIANMKVHWQSQIRNNWDKFLKDGAPETITFGVPLYEGKRGAAPMNEESITKYLENLPEEARVALLEKLGQA